MDEYSPSTIQRNKKRNNGKKQLRAVVYNDDNEGDRIGCSGKSCRSCSGGLIADCVAVCCCPCAVVNILALAFLKIPWMLGRKCLRMVKKKKLEEKKRKNDNSNYYYSSTDRVDSLEEGIDMSSSFGERIDVAEVWLDLYQVGHMGFGRVSFTGTNYADPNL